jgi:hypothetical protein
VVHRAGGCEAQGAGFDRLLVKPYDPDEVQRLLG